MSEEGAGLALGNGSECESSQIKDTPWGCASKNSFVLPHKKRCSWKPSGQTPDVTLPFALFINI